MPAPIDRTGEVVGKLMVIERVPPTTSAKVPHRLCRCECGRELVRQVFCSKQAAHRHKKCIRARTSEPRNHLWLTTLRKEVMPITRPPLDVREFSCHIQPQRFRDELSLRTEIFCLESR
jgi:hypothetical protein